jgi:hypothetical protein
LCDELPAGARGRRPLNGRFPYLVQQGAQRLLTGGRPLVFQGQQEGEKINQVKRLVTLGDKLCQLWIVCS